MRKNLFDESHTEVIGDVLYIDLVAGDKADELAPKLDDIIDTEK